MWLQIRYNNIIMDATDRVGVVIGLVGIVNLFTSKCRIPFLGKYV